MMTNTLIVDYIIPNDILDYHTDEFLMPSKTKYCDRGWNHPEYAALLYPQAMLDHLTDNSNSLL